MKLFLAFLLIGIGTYAQTDVSKMPAIAANYLPATVAFDGHTLTDNDVDGVLIIKKEKNFYVRNFNGPAFFSWWGVIPNDGKDDYAASQKAINDCIKFKNVSALCYGNGTYDYSEGLVIRRGEIGKPSEYVTLSIYGDGNSFDPSIGGGTQINLLDKNGAAFYLQKGKGCTIENLRGIGQNKGLYNYTMYDVVNDKSTFITNGVSDARTAPHAFIVIDPFGSKDVAQKYKGKEKFYSEVSISGSTSIKLDNIYASAFVAGICISPAGLQNGENIFITNPWVDYCKSGITTGSTQNRTVQVKNFTCWGNTLYCFDSYSYSPGGNGCPPYVDGFNIAGGNKWIYRCGAWYGNAFTLNNGHAEEVYGLGGCFEGRTTSFYMNRGDIYLMGTQMVGNKLIRLPNQILQCGLAGITNSLITYYGKPQAYIGLSVAAANVITSTLSSPLTVTQGILRYNLCDFSTHSEPPSDGLAWENVTGEAVKVLGVDEKTNTWTFITEKENLGSYVSYYSKTLKGEFGYGGEVFFGGGIVEKVSNKLVTVKGIPYQLEKGIEISVYTQKLKKK